MKKIIYPILFSVVLIAGVFIYFIFMDQKGLNRSPDLNVLLITLDTTRADRIGCYGYKMAKTPNLDRLASKGVMFSNAYCQVPLTLPSHCSILTGTYPLYHRVHSNGGYYLVPDNHTLAEKLEGNGFETAAFVSSFTLDSRFGLDQGFDFYDDKFDTEEVLKSFFSERRADKVFTSFSDWLDKNYYSKFFAWIHFFDPHAPYEPPSPYKEEFADRPYDGEISYMDFYIGKIMKKLTDLDLIGNTFIVLVGDHGEAFGEKRERDHGLFIYDVTMKVPFILYSEYGLPRGMTVDARVRLIDVMPTILDMLNIPPADEGQGISLLSYVEEESGGDLSSYIETYFPREYYGWSELIGLVDGEWKYIQAPKPELYNLKRDPGEKMNLFFENKMVSSELTEKLKNVIEQYSTEKAMGKRKMSLEEQEKLLSLGYFGYTLTGGRLEGPLLDPKVGIKEQGLHFKARQYEDEGDFVNAALCYEEILDSKPLVPWDYVRLCEVYMKMNRRGEAIQTLEKGRENLPDSILILSRLSEFYFEAQRYEEAHDTNLVVLSREPRYFNALFMSGIIMKMMKKWPEALDYFERAIRIEPENISVQLQRAYCLGVFGEADEALDLYTKLKQNFSEDYRIYQDLGVFYDSLGKHDLARENFRRVIELNPVPETYFNFAIFLEKIGDLKEAIHFLELYLENAPDLDSVKKNRAEKLYLEWQKCAKSNQQPK